MYNHLKGLNTNQTQIKCNVDDGPIGDLVEEITISRPILVRCCLFLSYTHIHHTLGELLWFHFCWLVLIFHCFSCTMPSSKTSIFSFTLWTIMVPKWKPSMWVWKFIMHFTVEFAWVFVIKWSSLVWKKRMSSAQWKDRWKSVVFVHDNRLSDKWLCVSN